MDELQFDSFNTLHLIWAVLGLVGVFAYGAWRRRRELAAFATANLHGALTPSVSPGRRRAKAALTLLGLACLVAAAMGPRWGFEYEEVRQKGIDVMVLMDVSRSMLAEDATPSRLERAKQDVRDLLRVLGGDRIGLLTFAGSATLSCPLTTDYSFFRLALDEVDTRSTSQMGSRLGDAIEKAVACFDDELDRHKAIVMFSDGEDHDTDAIEAAKNAYEEHGVRIFTVGLGDAAEGARIPIRRGAETTYLLHEGQEVWSKLNSGLLESLARDGGGAYVPAGTANFDVEGFYERYIGSQEKKEFGTNRVKRYFARFQWFAGPGLALLVISSLISERRPTKWVTGEEPAAVIGFA
jgi:Ca-activated chloride channel family protein